VERDLAIEFADGSDDNSLPPRPTRAGVDDLEKVVEHLAACGDQAA
jgi:hypothetical protein